jgi:hypothetical protein
MYHRDDVEMYISHLQLRCANVNSISRICFGTRMLACRGVVLNDLDFWNILVLLYADGFD